MVRLSFVSCPQLLPVRHRLRITDAANVRCPSVQMCQAHDHRVAKPLIDLRGIRYTVPLNFAKKLFRGADISVCENEFVVIIGENGAGKSTLLSIMIGFTKPDSGQIFWKSEKIRIGKLVSNIGMVMQRPSDFFIGETVLEELVLGRDEATPDDVRDVLKSVGLHEISLLADPRELSGGQMKRMAVASQLMRRPIPELFLMDEPMAGVDPLARREMAVLLSELRKRFAIVIVSHEPGELIDYADRVVQIAHGRLREVDRSVIESARRIRRARNLSK